MERGIRLEKAETKEAGDYMLQGLKTLCLFKYLEENSHTLSVNQLVSPVISLCLIIDSLQTKSQIPDPQYERLCDYILS